VYTLLKQASAIASEHATEDQASDHSHQTLVCREEFELNITEDPPTPDQLKSILEYIGTQRASTIVKGAKNKADAMKKLKENAENFQKPVVRCTTSKSLQALSNQVADYFYRRWTGRTERQWLEMIYPRSCRWWKRRRTWPTKYFGGDNSRCWCVREGRFLC
jgi:hypothetical protein